MTQSVVIELQELASSSDNNIGQLLRKTLMVATKLGLPEFRQWALAELNGYTGEARKNLPEYRTVRGELKAVNPVRGLIPMEVPHQLHDTLSEINVTESIHSLEQLISTAASGYVLFNFSAKQEQLLMSMQNDFVRFQPTRIVGINRLTAILSAVRTTVLDWALALEADGILGEGLLFTAREKQAAMSNINIQNFQGILGNIEGGSSVSQTNSQQITASDFSTLARYLSGQGVTNADVQDLARAVDLDPEPSSSAQFGPRVSTWIGKMISKAASGSWEISVATAGGLITNALSKYYGFSA